MTGNQHARLVAAVSDAKEAQGFSWKQIATMGGYRREPSAARSTSAST